MHITYQAANSRMQGRIHDDSTFLLYLTPSSLTPDVTLSGAEVTRILAHHVMGAHLALDIAKQITSLPACDSPTRPRLLGQHKALRGR
jgi:hypothetical protein